MKWLLNPRKKIGLFICEALLGGFLGIMAGWPRSAIPGVGVSMKQPIEFAHETHSFKCIACHQYVQTQPVAGIPGLDVCMDCHNEKDERKKSAKTEKIREMAKDGMQMEWLKFINLPRDVVFPHDRHVGLGGIDCQVCHGGITSSTATSMWVTVPSMEWCTNCHQEKNVTKDCLSCHT